MSSNLGSIQPTAGIMFEGAVVARKFLDLEDSAAIRVEGLLRPKNEEDVKAVVDWANKNSVALVPISSPGGSRRRSLAGLDNTPVVILDLSRMARMIHADAEDAIAVIEPGLTFLEFDAHLKEHGLRSIKPFLPRQSKSVLACYLEREPTMLPGEHWDTTDPLACLSLVMGNGERFRSGGASLYEDLDEGLKNGARHLMASGPIGTDYSRVMLGSQGTLGVTSWASIYCERIPKLEKGHLYGADKLDEVMSIARHLSLHQLGAQLFVLSKTQLAAAVAKDGDDFVGLRASFESRKVPAWCLYVNITASDFLPEKKMDWQLADLTAHVKTLAVELVSERYPELLNALESRLHSIPETYYKNTPKGDYTEVFCLAKSSNVSALVRVAEDLLLTTDIDSGVYVQPTIQGVTAHLDVTLFHTAEQSQLAAKLEMRLLTALADKGGFFSRPYGDWSEDAFTRNESIVPQLRKVKKLFDPEGVLSPGKLCY